MSKGKLRLGIKHEGQAYVDEPIVVEARKPQGVAAAVAAAYGGANLPKPLTVGHERIYLNWVKPGPASKGKA